MSLKGQSGVESDAGEGVEARFHRLCGYFRGDLVRFVTWMTRNRALAEDAVQETLIRAWRHLDSLRDPLAARAWLLTIARREANRLLQRARADDNHMREHAQTIQTTTTATAATRPEILELRAAIWRLPDEYREPLVRQVLLGQSAKEIAFQMNLAVPAVLVRLHRARLALGERLGRLEPPVGLRVARALPDLPDISHEDSNG